MADLRVFGKENQKAFIARETFAPICDKSTKNRPLSIRVGDELIFCKDADGGSGCIVENKRSQKRGFVSKELLIDKSDQLETPNCPWYFGLLSREVATRYLSDHVNINGSFLVRRSQNKPGHFVLSIKYFNFEAKEYGVTNLQISNLQGRVKLNQVTSDNLSDLIDKLMETGIQSTACANVIKLTHPCLLVRSQVPDTGCVDKWLTAEEEIDIHDLVQVEHPGLVFQGRWRGVVNCLVKVVAKIGAKQVAPKASVTIEREIDMLKKLRHPNVLQLLGHSWKAVEGSSGAEQHMILEEMDYGSVSNFLRTRAHSIMTFEDFTSIARDVIRALSFLHDKAIIHRNVGAHSVYLNRQMTAKLGDFSFAREVVFENMRDLDTAEDAGCKYKWRAIETVDNQVSTPKSDIWSLGIFFWEMLTFGEIPYRGMDRYLMIHELRNCGYQLPCPSVYCGINEKALAQVYEILTDCWNLEPTERPTLVQMEERISHVEQRYSDYAHC